MQPHSAVNDSNYDSIASPVSPWVKGESHATRMRRVDNMRRISYSPSLQPEGTMSGVKNLFEGYGMGALLFTGLCGAAFGIKSGKPTGSKKSREAGKTGIQQSALAGLLIGGIHAGTTRDPLLSVNTESLVRTLVPLPSPNMKGLGHPVNNYGEPSSSYSFPKYSTERGEDMATMLVLFPLIGALGHGIGRYFLLNAIYSKDTIPAFKTISKKLKV
jgi:hypothetical protein|tara:strand:+ start:32721 stop:33368 length:648 start_codon:yes stop_codon:yes gene_type:complete